MGKLMLDYFSAHCGSQLETDFLGREVKLGATQFRLALCHSRH